MESIKYKFKINIRFTLFNFIESFESNRQKSSLMRLNIVGLSKMVFPTFDFNSKLAKTIPFNMTTSLSFYLYYILLFIFGIFYVITNAQ